MTAASYSYSSSSYSKNSYSSNYEPKYNPFDYDAKPKYSAPKWEPEPSVFDGID